MCNDKFSSIDTVIKLLRVLRIINTFPTHNKRLSLPHRYAGQPMESGA